MSKTPTFRALPTLARTAAALCIATCAGAATSFAMDSDTTGNRDMTGMYNPYSQSYNPGSSTQGFGGYGGMMGNTGGNTTGMSQGSDDMSAKLLKHFYVIFDVNAYMVPSSKTMDSMSQ